MAQDKQPSRKGGLGRGLAALIPSAAVEEPIVAESAADIIFGPRKNRAAAQSPSSQSKQSGDSESLRRIENLKENGFNSVSTTKARKRHSDTKGELKGGTKVSGEAAKPVAPTPERNRDVSRETFAAATSTDKGVAKAGVVPVSSVGIEASGSVSAGADSAVDFGASYREISLKLISPNPRQPREVFEEEPLQELAHSIREFGLLQPVIVRVMPQGNAEAALNAARQEDPAAPQPLFELIMGERRWRAAHLAGLDAIPAIVRETPDADLLRDALLENIHRVQLNPLEEAAAYQQLLDEFGVTQAQLAERIGRSRPVITNMIRLLQLPVDVQRRVAAGVLSAGHARAILGLKDTSLQSQLANQVVAEGMSVRATEEYVTLANNGAPQRQKREAPPQPEALNSWANRLADSFDTKVTAHMGKRKGKIVIEFGDLDDFDRIMSLMNLGEH